ncbi:uncharacterized protein STEHIDRAFT_115643 [Stereum hirsutum FP-91666 SS1]|uniref:uncharacterized protein n=1 Tax=Stereum hirsutum (strain FP-91666) TaxID=721885 RepID=UPI000444A8A7|nr:uncharacterized protein STEHIDRAFT_115643 [Stereum hirsutum FP-91666 SS1]EIM80794.1 hypothetical protein STEHIDRAFT_115643 [Stereum hirsutum FP-91666 SS1]
MSSQSIFQTVNAYIGFVASAITIGACAYTVFKLKDNEEFRNYFSRTLPIRWTNVTTVASDRFVVLSSPFTRNGTIHREMQSAFSAIRGVVAGAYPNVADVVKHIGRNIRGLFANFSEVMITTSVVNCKILTPVLHSLCFQCIAPATVISLSHPIISAGEDNHALEELQHDAAQLDPTTIEPDGVHVIAPADKDMQTGIEGTVSSSGSTSPTAEPQRIVDQPPPPTVESDDAHIPMPAGAAVHAGIGGAMPSSDGS